MDNLEPSNDAMYIIDEGISFMNTVKDVGLSINMIVINDINQLYYKMKTVIVLGTGNSGAGAIHDYLLSREDFQSPFAPRCSIGSRT